MVTAFGVQLRAGDQQLFGHVQGESADGAEERAGGGDDAAPGLGEREPGCRRGDDQIAGERDLEATTERDSLDRGDKRLDPPSPDEPVLPAAFGSRTSAILQIGSGAEHRLRAGEYADPQGRIIIEPVERRVDTQGRVDVDRVALVLALDTHDQDPAASLLGYRHLKSPASLAPPG